MSPPLQWIAALDAPWRGVAVAAGFTAAAFATGHAALAVARARLRHPFDHALVAFTLGLDLLALVLLAVGSVALPSAGALAVVLVTLAAAGLVLAARSLRAPALRARVLQPGAWLVVMTLAAVPALSALCLPVGWDELTYRLEVPLRWLRLGHFAVLPDNPYSAFPGLFERLATASIALGGLTAPRALLLVAWVASGLGIHRLARTHVRPAIALAIALAFAWAPVVLMVVADGYVEAFLALHLIAALLVLRHGRGPVAAGLAGALAGFAAAVKLTGLIALPAALLGAWRPRAARSVPAGVLVAAATAGLALAPFLVPALRATGNPVYPLAVEALGPGGEAFAETGRYHHLVATERYGLPGWRGFLVAPLALTTRGHVFSGHLGLQWPALLGAAVLAAIGRRGLRLLAAAMLAYAAWFGTAQQSRFLLPAVVLVAVAAAAGASMLPRRARLPAALLLAALTLAGVGRDRWLHHWSVAQSALRVGQAPSLAEYLYTGTGDGLLPALAALDAAAPPDARVLLLFELRGLYVPREHELGTPFVQPVRFTPPEQVLDADAVLRELRDDGFDHVLVGSPRRHPDVVPDLARRAERLRDLVAELRARGDLETVFDRDGFAILRVRREAGQDSR